MARNRDVAVAKLTLRCVVPGDHYVLELQERRLGSESRIVTIEDLGPSPVNGFARDAWSTVFEELLTWMTGDVVELDVASML